MAGAEAAQMLPAFYYVPSYRSSGTLSVQVPMMNPEASGINALAGAGMWVNNMLRCKAAAISGH